MIRTVLLLSCLCVAHVLAWGPVGHEVVASIAQDLLSSDVASQVNNILNGDSLSDVANWADQVKGQKAYSWSAILHYVDTDDWACNYKKSRDCGDDNCVTGAIANYTDRLTDSSLPDKQITEALKFLVHFTGDIHQPLHVGFKGDEGGNTIRGTFEGSSDSLHYVWDTDMIEKHLNDDFNNDQDQYVQYLQQQLSSAFSGNVSTWQYCPDSSGSCPDTWASDTVQYTCTQAYVDQNGQKIPNGFTLGDDYYNFNVDVVDFQLIKGGVRLANLLNNALNSSRNSLPSSAIPKFVIA